MSQTILVQDYMTASPHSIGVTLSIADAKNMMAAYQIRHLPVLDGGKLVGVVSERDVQMLEAMETGNLEEVTVEEAMSQAPYTVGPTTPLQVAATHMHLHKLGSAVVMTGTRVIGVFTVTDGMRALSELLGAIPQKPAALEPALVEAPPPLAPPPSTAEAKK